VAWRLRRARSAERARARLLEDLERTLTNVRPVAGHISR
jgi:hypothetical protein